jgi:hypothetical protein
MEISFLISSPNRSSQRVHYSALARNIAGGMVNPSLPHRRDVRLGGKRCSNVLSVAKVNPSVLKAAAGGWVVCRSKP